MNRLKLQQLFILWSLICAPLFAQETVVERLLEDQEETSEQSELHEIILDMQENPVDLNSADLSQLARIPLLTTQLSLLILDYRDKQGPFSSKEELLQIPGISSEVFELISELVTVRKRFPSQVTIARVDWRARMTDRIESSRGFKDGTYESSSQKLYNRIRFELPQLVQGAVLLEKDAGERRLDDLRLFYLQAQFSPNVSVIIGNYLLEAGQGLVLWSPYGFSKSAEAIYPIRRKSRGLRGYTSVDESAGFFGGAVTLQLKQIALTAFVSKNKLDATPTSENTVSGFVTTGFHRNASEISKKDLVSESTMGALVKYRPAENLTIGLTGYRSTYNKMVADPDLIRNRFKFRGDMNSVIGANWLWLISNASVFGEIARSRNGSKALLLGTHWEFGPIQLAFLYRDYEKDFHNFHGFGFGNSNGTTQNERGFYAGLRYKLTPSTTVNAFYDIYKNPWRTFFEPLPRTGSDFLGQVEQKVHRRLALTLRIRNRLSQETDEIFDTHNRPRQIIVEIQRTQLRAQIDYRLSNHLDIRNRIEYVHVKQNSFELHVPGTRESGLALFQELKVKVSPRLQIRGRLTFFDTKSFTSRVFQYEHDLPGLATNAALFGRGSRWYALLKYAPSELIELSVKYSETYRDDVDVIGSGPDQIDSNLDRRVGLQVEFRLR